MSGLEAAKLPDQPACPHCGETDTELMSPFGSVLANAQYYCHGCRSTFEFMKWQASDQDAD